MTTSLLICALLVASPIHASTSDELATTWRAVLESPGGELPFRLDFPVRGPEYTALVHNGDERVKVGEVKREGSTLTLRLDPYDSYLHLRLAPDGESMSGFWEKSLGGNRKSRLPAHALAGELDRFPLVRLDADQRRAIDGRWAVHFATDEEISIGHFQSFEDGRLHGTFETTLGDYRFLAGSFDGKRLRLSCFDGGHAFLFDASLDDEGRLDGGFWSRDSWHETWTAEKDDQARLPDSFELTSWNDAVLLDKLSFPDLTGKTRSLTDPAFAGEVRIITLFGSWCPNCNDEADFLAELQKSYGRRGLSILGLAFELDDDLARSKRQVESFTRRHSLRYPILIAGTSDKQQASRAMPLLDKVRAYPTTIFLDRDAKVRAVHTGFSGPATGAAHERMKERYELLIQQLLEQRDGQ
jgi:thiol-disulfide isomerase/thioredoxin